VLGRCFRSRRGGLNQSGAEKDNRLDRRNSRVILKTMDVCLDQNFMARVPEKFIRLSEDLILRKRVAEHEETISFLIDVLDLPLER